MNNQRSQAFNLSEKIWESSGYPVIYLDDIAEFIRLLKIEVNKYSILRDYKWINDTVDRLAGKKFK